MKKIGLSYIEYLEYYKKQKIQSLTESKNALAQTSYIKKNQN